MKTILITGENSYIGTAFENYLKRWPGIYKVNTVDMINASWREKIITEYDVIFHVAGIAHSDTGNVDEEKKALYYRINTDLALEVAKKAKAEGIRQFIFMSSAIIYGDSAPIGKQKVITKDTPASPSNFYGDSKLQAETSILKLNDDNFKVVILRPPMVYGKGSKGNYNMLSAIAKKLPLFPYVNNARSMLYIENLVEFVRLMIENEESGIFFPQNDQYSNTSEMVQMIAAVHGRNIYLVPGFEWVLKILSPFSAKVNKAFGNLVYEPRISEYKENYRIISLPTSIELTEK